jgi:hypothetical protein
MWVDDDLPKELHPGTGLNTEVKDTIADFNLGISHTPGKANVIADALGRKAY